MQSKTIFVCCFFRSFFFSFSFSLFRVFFVDGIFGPNLHIHNHRAIGTNWFKPFVSFVSSSFFLCSSIPLYIFIRCMVVSFMLSFVAFPFALPFIHPIHSKQANSALCFCCAVLCFVCIVNWMDCRLYTHRVSTNPMDWFNGFEIHWTHSFLSAWSEVKCDHHHMNDTYEAYELWAYLLLWFYFLLTVRKSNCIHIFKIQIYLGTFGKSVICWDGAKAWRNMFEYVRCMNDERFVYV